MAEHFSEERLRPPVRVHSFTEDVAGNWDRFVQEQPCGSLFHLTAWKRSIEKTFHYEPCYVYAERGGRITAIAPVFAINNWIVGRCLISAPYAVYGGICAADAESEQALIEHLKNLAQSRQADYLELRFRQHELLPGFASNPLYFTFTTKLSSDHETNLKSLPKDTRYMIRKATKAGLRAQRGLHQMNDFYHLFAVSMKRLGTPALPRALFENLANEFEGKTDLLLVYAGDKPVTGVFSFRFREAILPYYAGANAEATLMAANNFMYAELMKLAAEEGLTEFDFGRSKRGTGAYSFKTQWNMRAEPLTYQVHLVNRKTLPNFSPANPRFELATRVWKHIPLPLTTWLGPHVVRWFP